MIFDEFKTLAKAMRSVYTTPNFLPDEESVVIWYTFLQDIPYQTISLAVQKYIMTNEFPPTIAALRELAVEITQGAHRDWGECWNDVMMAVRKYGMPGETEAMESLDNITKQCVKRLGFRNICLSKDIAIERANFRMLYEQIVAREKERNKISPRVREEIAKITQSVQPRINVS